MVYRLYILSTAGAVTVKLSVSDLPGGSHQKIMAYTYTGAKVSMPGNRALLEQQQSLYYAGESGAIATTGLLFTYVEFIGTSSGPLEAPRCFFVPPAVRQE